MPTAPPRCFAMINWRSSVSASYIIICSCSFHLVSPAVRSFSRLISAAHQDIYPGDGTQLRYGIGSSTPSYRSSSGIRSRDSFIRILPSERQKRRTLPYTWERVSFLHAFEFEPRTLKDISLLCPSVSVCVLVPLEAASTTLNPLYVRRFPSFLNTPRSNMQSSIS